MNKQDEIIVAFIRDDLRTVYKGLEEMDLLNLFDNVRNLAASFIVFLFETAVTTKDYRSAREIVRRQIKGLDPRDREIVRIKYRKHLGKDGPKDLLNHQFAGDTPLW